jgi:hypothetical protein
LNKVETFEIAKKKKKITFSKSKDKDNESLSLIQNNKWLYQPIHQNLIFAEPEILLKIDQAFKTNLDLFIFGDKPTMKQLVDAIKEIACQVKRYDKEI